MKRLGALTGRGRERGTDINTTRKTDPIGRSEKPENFNLNKTSEFSSKERSFRRGLKTLILNYWTNEQGTNITDEERVYCQTNVYVYG